MGMGPGHLHDDIMSYLAGGEPSADELAAAPMLENWGMAVVCLPRCREMYLCGRICGHPSIDDGDRATTSAVAWLDRKGRWARTRSRVYRLGTRGDRGGKK